MGRHPGVSEGNPSQDTIDRQERFLKAFESLGIISKAAKVAKVSAATVQSWRKNDILFLEQMNAARQVHNDHLEGVLFDLISEMHVNKDYKANPTLLIFALNGANPEKYKGINSASSDAKDVLSEFRKAMRESKDLPPTARKMDPEEVQEKSAVQQASDILKSKFGSLNDTDT